MTWNDMLLTLAVCVAIWLAGRWAFRRYESLRWWFGHGPRVQPPPAAIARHPAGKVRGLPRDGRPLDDYELRILGRIAGDSIVEITFEPDYDRGESR